MVCACSTAAFALPGMPSSSLTSHTRTSAPNRKRKSSTRASSDTRKKRRLEKEEHNDPSFVPPSSSSSSFSSSSSDTPSDAIQSSDSASSDEVYNESTRSRRSNRRQRPMRPCRQNRTYAVPGVTYCDYSDPTLCQNIASHYCNVFTCHTRQFCSTHKDSHEHTVYQHSEVYMRLVHLCSLTLLYYSIMHAIVYCRL